MKSKTHNSLLNIFLLFLALYSIVSIYLDFIQNHYSTTYEIINLLGNLLQIFFIVFIFFRKKVGVYGFILLRLLNCFSSLILNGATKSVFIVVINNVLILIAFYIFYSTEYKEAKSGS